MDTGVSALAGSLLVGSALACFFSAFFSSFLAGAGALAAGAGAAAAGAAGLAASFVKHIDKFLPSRYDSGTEGGESVIARANSAIDEWTPAGATNKDEIAEARSIAKKAVDVINARALAASGGNRMLVSEVNMQKGVIGLEGLSQKSAVKVYKDLAESDLKSLGKLGIERDETASSKCIRSSNIYATNRI